MSTPTHSLLDVRLADIRVLDGFNPRRHFKPAPLAELVESIKRDGVFTPVTLRRTSDGRLELIAGERRLRASREAGLESIPAKVIECCDDITAKRISLIENMQREGLSSAEEALAARDYLDLYEGDMQLARNDLGWSEQKFRARLLLLQASPEVLDAVGSGAITTGHAELLSALPHLNQSNALPQIIEKAMTVGQLKEMLRGFVIPLSTAIFNLDGCKNCPRNSETQRDFFSNTVDGANCQDRSCFLQKTALVIEAKRTALLDEVSTVGKASEKAPGTYALLMREGTHGVGDAQFSACRSCKHFGVLIHDQLNARCGQIDRPACFDVQCNSTKIADFAAAEKAAAAKAAAGETASTPDAAPATKGAMPKAKPKTKTACVALTSGPVRDHIKTVYREAASALMDAEGRALLAAAVMGIAKLPGNANASVAIDKALGNKSDSCNSPAKRIAELSLLPQAELAGLVKEVSKHFVGNAEAAFEKVGLETAIRLAQTHSIDLAAHFTMNAAFLASNTMSGIEALLDESGFTAWLAAQADGAARAKVLKSKKKSDLPAAVMAEGFDWTGFVPNVIRAATPEELTK